MEDHIFNLSSFNIKTFNRGDVILKEGNPAGPVYILKSGSIQVMLGDNILCTVNEPGMIFGEIAFMLKCNHTASVLASTKVTLYAIDDFLSYLQNEPENIQKISRLVQHRLMNTGNKVLEKLPVEIQFSGCDVEEFPAKKTVIKEGEKGGTIYVLKKGTIKVVTSENVIYRGSTPGRMFGEVAALEEEGKHTTSVITVTHCSLYVIHDVLSFFNTNPLTSLQIAKNLANSLRSSIDQYINFKAEVMRTRTQHEKKNLVSKLVQFSEIIPKDLIANPFSKRKK